MDTFRFERPSEAKVLKLIVKERSALLELVIQGNKISIV
jgi:hypothetical protein